MSDDNEGNSTAGYGAYVSMIISAIGILAAVHPKWSWLVTLSQYKDDLRNVLAPVLVGVGTFGAALSHPPAWLRTPWDDLKFWIASFFHRKSAP